MRKLHIYCIILLVLSLAAAISVMFFTKMGNDSVKPEIKMNDSEIYVSVNASDEELLKGVFAFDNKDGDVTNTMVIESLSNFIERGRRRVTIVAFDNDDNAAKAVRDVIYTDYTPPRFSVSAPFIYTSGYGDLFGNVTASDCLDGDISDKIMVEVNSDEKGSSSGARYAALLTVSNSAGDVSELPVTVMIYDPSERAMLPVIELSEYLIYLSPENDISPLDYVKQISVDGNAYIRGGDGTFRSAADPELILDTSRISVNNPVVKNEAGVYEIVYSVTGDSGAVGEVRLIVVVEQ